MFWELVGWMAPLDARAVEKDVNTIVREDSTFDGEQWDDSGHGSSVGEVSHEDDAAAAKGSDGVVGCRVVWISLRTVSIWC